MTKTGGLLRSDDYDDDLSRNNLFTVHKKAIYLDTFYVELSCCLLRFRAICMESTKKPDSNLRQVVENF